MAFENKPLKTAAQLAMEKVGEPKKENRVLRSAAEIASEGGPQKKENEYAKRIQEERADLMAAEAKVDEVDVEKIKALEITLGKLPQSIMQKEEKIKAETGESVHQDAQPTQEDILAKYGRRTEEENKRAVDTTNEQLKMYTDAQEAEINPLVTAEKPKEEDAYMKSYFEAMQKPKTQEVVADNSNVAEQILGEKPQPRTWEDVQKDINKNPEGAQVKGAWEGEKIPSSPSGRFDQVTNKGEAPSHEPIIKKDIPFDVEELLKRKPANNVEALPEVKINPNEVTVGKDGKKGISPKEFMRLSKMLGEDEMIALMENAEELKDEDGEAKAETQQTEEEPIIKEQVQSEAIKDFTNELKGIKKNELWKDDPIMQGMEDFANSFKEKTPMTETLKDMFSFIKKKGAEINSGRLTAKKAIGEFSKKSAKWAEKIFGGAKIGKSNEALRIDEIMGGGDRSIGAIKVDQAMGRAREAGEAEKNSVIERDLEKAQSMDDLINSLSGVETVTSADGKTYKVPDQQAFIDKLFKTGDKRFLNWLAKGPVKENAKRVFNEEHKKSSAEAKAEKGAA